MDYQTAIATIVGAGAVLLTTRLLRTRSEKEFKIRRNNWEKDHVYLFMFGSIPDCKLPSPSPSCAKLELFLKYTGIPYTIVESFDTGPTEKLPYIELNGKAYGESTYIIDMLSKKFSNADIDKDMSDHQRALAYLFTVLIEEHMYFLEVHQRWIVESNFARLTDCFFAAAPKLLRGFIARKIRKSVVQSLHGQGVGRLTDEIRDFKVAKTLDAISCYFNDGRRFSTGESLRTVDLVMYAQLGGIIDMSRLGSNIVDKIKSYPNIMEYLDRVEKEVNNGFEA